MFGLLYHEPLSYMGYSYPTWAEWLGWGLATSSILMIPIVAIITLIKTPGSFKEVSLLLPTYKQKTQLLLGKHLG